MLNHHVLIKMGYVSHVEYLSESISSDFVLESDRLLPFPVKVTDDLIIFEKNRNHYAITNHPTKDL